MVVWFINTLPTMKNSISLNAVTFLLLVAQSKSTKTTRHRRANLDNFNILLNIYKMNPLKHSNVFNAFSNSILLPRPDGPRPALNYNSDESSMRNDTADLIRIDDRVTHKSTSPSMNESELILKDLSAVFNSTFDKIIYNKFKNGGSFEFEKKSLEQLKRESKNNRGSLKVYNLNAKNEENKVNYKDAGVVILK